MVDFIFRTPDTIYRLLILASSGLYIILYNNGRFLTLDISVRFLILDIGGRSLILDIGGRFLILDSGGRFFGHFRHQWSIFLFWTLEADFRLWTLGADFGFYLLFIYIYTLAENECIFHVTRVQCCNTSANYN